MIRQYPSILIIVKTIGLLSMIASSFIIRHISKRLLKSQPRPDGSDMTREPGSLTHIVSKITLTQGIMLCLSCGDFISSFFVPFLSTWMVPKDTELIWSSGNVRTCTAQGYISVMFFGLSVYSNASLAVSHCLVVRHNWKDDEKQQARLYFTLTPAICAFILSIIPLIWQNYNYNGGFYCDISGSPLGCDYDRSTPCERGDNSRMVLLFVQVIPFLIAFAVIIVAVSLLCHTVYTQERKMDKYRRGNQEPNRKLTTETAYQAIFYIGAFAFAWIPWYCYAFDEVTGNGVLDVFDYLHIFTKPFQGVLNALVYFRPKYLSTRARYKTETRVESLCRVLELPVPQWWVNRIQAKQRQENEEGAKEENNKSLPGKEKGECSVEEIETAEAGERGMAKISTLSAVTFAPGPVVVSSTELSSSNVTPTENQPTKDIPG